MADLRGCLTFAVLVILLGAACAVSSSPAISPPTATFRQLVEFTPDPSMTVIPPATPAPGTPRAPMPTAALTATPTSSPSATSMPAATLTPGITLMPTATSTPIPLPSSVLLEPMNHQWQTFNNCHRASVAIALGYYDYRISQHAVRFQYGLGHCQIPDFVSRYELEAPVYRFPLARDRKVLAIRQLLALGIPVIVLQRVSIGSSTYHFRVVHGYDDPTGELICDDPLLGPAHRISYDTFVRLGGTLLVPIYLPQMDAQVQSLLGELGASHWTDEDGLTCDALQSR